MKMKRSSILAFSAAIVAAVFMLSGCETESAASAQITISPSAATLTAANPSVSLTASGGWGYTWSLQDESAGTLNRRSGSSVIYTATKFGGDDEEQVEQVITVANSGTTNSVSATAVITQK